MKRKTDLCTQHRSVKLFYEALSNGSALQLSVIVILPFRLGGVLYHHYTDRPQRCQPDFFLTVFNICVTLDNEDNTFVKSLRKRRPLCIKELYCKKFFCLLLVCILALGAVGCTRTQLPSISYTELVSIMNQTVDSKLNEAIVPIDWTAHAGRVWACGYQPDGFSSMEEIEPWIASANADGSNVSAIHLAFEPDKHLVQQKMDLEQENQDLSYHLVATLQSILFDRTDSPYLVLEEQLLAVDDQAQTNTAVVQQHTLCSITAEGALQRQVQLQWPENLADNIFDYRPLRPVDFILCDGTLWVQLQGNRTNDNSLAAGLFLRFDTTDGSCTAQLGLPAEYRADSDRNSMRLMSDGSILLYARHSNNKYDMFTIREATGETPTLSAVIPLDLARIQGFVPAIDGAPNDRILLRTAKGVSEYDMQTGTLTSLMEWEMYGVLQEDDPTSAMFYFPKGGTLQMLRISKQQGLSVLSVLDEAELAKLPTITVAVAQDDAKKAAYMYNAAGNEYYIKTVDYSGEAAAAAGYASTVDMLQQHILAGTAPDMFLLNSALGLLAEKGTFVDLFPYIDNDPQLSREDFLPGIVSANQLGDTLPGITVSYVLQTLVGDTDVVGTDISWTWQDYTALTDQYPDAVPIYMENRTSILLTLLRGGGSKFIDYHNHTAHLDSPDFITLLQASADYPIESGDSTLNPKAIFAERQALLDATVLSHYRDIILDEYSFDGPVTYKGFPSGEGNCGTTFVPYMQMYISSSCQNPDAAWDFARTLLLPDYQNSFTRQFPLRQDALPYYAAAAQQRADRFYAIPAYIPLPQTAEQTAYFSQGISAQQAEQITALLEQVDTMQQFDLAITRIIMDEADYFYNGVRSAEEAAAIMQNRVQTYLDEQS